MKDILKSWMGKDVTIEEFLNDRLDGSEYDRGVVEEVAKTSSNTKEAFARLCAILESKNVLTKEDIFLIGTGYAYEEEV